MRWLLMLLAVVLLGGCKCGKTEPQDKGKVRRFVSKKDKVRKPQQRTYLAASHIVVAYKGARGADPKVTRGKGKAKQLARDLAVRLKRNPAIFAEQARKHSDAVTAENGGYLGAWPRGRMPKGIEEVVDGLVVGEVSKEPIETPQGYQILRRHLAVLAGSQILISWRGARGKPPKVFRNKIEARALADKIHGMLEKNPAQFTFLAGKHSEDRASARRGGTLGAWPRGRRLGIIEQALDRLEIGQVSRPVDTPRGWLILRRNDPYPNQ